MAHRRLLPALWRASFAHFVPLMLLQAVSDFIDGGVSWSTAADAVLALPVFAFLSFVFAAFRTRSLVRRARDAGVAVGGDALKDTQAHALRGIPFPRIRTELIRDDRALSVLGAETGNPLRLRWRPFRSRTTVKASVTFDEASGEARVEVSAVEGLPLLHRGAAFVALCQIVRSATLTEAAGRGVKRSCPE